MNVNQIILDSLKKMYADGRLTEEKLEIAITKYELTLEQVSYIKGE